METWHFGSSTSSTSPQIPSSGHPLLSYDVIVTNGIQTTVPVFYNCITALPDYSGKSLEELRWEDYLLNRKYPLQAPLQTTTCSSSSNSRPMATASRLNIRNHAPVRPTPYPEKNEGTKLAAFRETELTEIVETTVPFKVLEAQLVNITAMTEYEKMSVEELRYYDYKNGLRFSKIGIF